MRKPLKQLLTEYGRVALGVYVVIFLFVLVGSWTAVHLGWRSGSGTGDVGAVAAAYLFTKLTQPLRIAATLVLTPMVAGVQDRLAGRRRTSAPGGSGPAGEVPAAVELGR